MLIVPAIDIMGGRVVRLARGAFDKVTTYDLDPVAFAERWVREGARFLHVVDLDGAKAGEPRNFDAVIAVAHVPGVTIEVGGGIRSVATVKRYLDAGVSRVVLSTKIIEDSSFLLSDEMKPYLDRVVVGLDIKSMASADVATGATAGWLQDGDVLVDIPSFISVVAKAGVKYMNFSDVTRDGMLLGADTRKIKFFLEMARTVGRKDIWFTYAGGIATLDDLKILKDMGIGGVDAVIVGRALYENKFGLKEAIAAVASC
jgi:phosphoribosylformimino-5-aminoimidazole carboxamide ribotide isomerase